MLKLKRVIPFAEYLLAIGVIAVLATLLRWVPAVTATAAAPVLLLSILLIARTWGTGPALAASVCAGGAFNYYFLPPSGFLVQELNDWVALLTFTLTAVIVGELSARAERRQLEAEQGRREIEQLYQQLGAAFERASQAEAARQSEQLKAALLDALTHNLRTPLTAIKAAVTALIGSFGVDHPTSLTLESRRELLQVIDEESDRLNRFIEGLSVADRPDPSQPQSNLVTAIAPVVREALTRADTVLRHHRVQTRLATDLPPLAVDPAAVAEVLYILLDNASKYSPADTTIRIDAALEDEHHMRLAVSDEGPGIPPELTEQVFERFFRIPGREAIDPRRKGIGLGLPIARRLVESQAGRIWIDRDGARRGTSVVLTLPVATPAHARGDSAEIPVAVRA